jgi:hypothetical protein
MRQKADEVGALIAQGISPEVAAAMISGTEGALEEGTILAEEFFKNIDAEITPDLEMAQSQATWDAFIEGIDGTNVTVNVGYNAGSVPTPGGGSSPPPGTGNEPQGTGLPQSTSTPSGSTTTVNNYNYTKEAAAVAAAMVWQNRRGRF